MFGRRQVSSNQAEEGNIGQSRLRLWWRTTVALPGRRALVEAEWIEGVLSYPTTSFTAQPTPVIIQQELLAREDPPLLFWEAEGERACAERELKDVLQVGLRGLR